MNRCIEIPLDSYRLAKYAKHVPCLICDEPNTLDAELCRHCQAPMALGFQAARQKQQPQMVAVLGASGVGKTVYLGMLMDMLSRDQSPLQVLARGAFSITLQQMTIAALNNCEFPDKTANEPDQWHWIHCLVETGRRRSLETILPDMAGEAILEEIDHPNTYPVIRALLKKCAGVMLLLDSIRMGDGKHDQEHFAMKVLTFLSELEGTSRRDRWQNKPVGLLLTKADQIEQCFEEPGQFLQEHAPGVTQLCTRRLRKTAVFATGVAGACAYRSVLGDHRVRVPLRIEPRGVIAPFAWMVQKLKR